MTTQPAPTYDELLAVADGSNYPQLDQQMFPGWLAYTATPLAYHRQPVGYIVEYRNENGVSGSMFLGFNEYGEDCSDAGLRRFKYQAARDIGDSIIAAAMLDDTPKTATTPPTDEG